jgi:hypothetical protein
MLGDTVFLGGVAALVWFLFGLVRGHSYDAAKSMPNEPELSVPAE